MNPLVLQFPNPDPIAFTVFGRQIYWYAIMYLIAFAIAYVLMRLRLHHEPYRSITVPARWTPEIVDDILFYSIIGVILGGRFGFVLFYQPAYFLQNPLHIFRIWEGGMSFHGGALGVILALALLGRIKHIPFLQLGDFLVPTIPLGLAAGRVGNFINGELWGREAPEGLPWAMIFPTGGDIPRHPSQIYQALLEGVLLFVILWLYARKPRFRGQVAGAFLLGYGVFRFIGEFFREPDAHLGFLSLGMSMGQWLSVPMMLAGAALLIWGQKAAIDDRELSTDSNDLPDVTGTSARDAAGTSTADDEPRAAEDAGTAEGTSDTDPASPR